MSEKGLWPVRVEDVGRGGRPRKMVMMLMKHSAQLFGRPVLCWGGWKLRNSWVQPWGELRIHRMLHSWCFASSCLSSRGPRYGPGPQRLAVGCRGG